MGVWGRFSGGGQPDIMSDSSPKTPLRTPITPPARRKAPFSRLTEPPIRPFDPPFCRPPPPQKKHPFCVHFRAPLFGQCARIYPRPPAPKQPVGSRHEAVSSTQYANLSITRSLNSSPFTIHNSLFSISAISQFFTIQHSELIIHNSRPLPFPRASCLPPPIVDYLPREIFVTMNSSFHKYGLY